MNKVFKVVFNKALGVFMAVSELTQNKGKRSEKSSNQNSIQVNEKTIKNKLFNFSLISVAFLEIFLPAKLLAFGYIGVNNGIISTNPDTKNSNSFTINLNPQYDTSGNTQGKLNGTVSEGGVAVGYQAEARGNSGVAVGINAWANSDSSTALGAVARVRAAHARGIAIGNNANVNADGGTSQPSDGIAIGTWSRVSGDSSIGIGYKTNLSKDKSIWIGSNKKQDAGGVSPGEGAIWIGAQTDQGSIQTTGNDADVILIGRDAYAQNGSKETILIGATARAAARSVQATSLGYNTVILGRQATAIGANSGASGQSIALGSDVYASGLSALALGSDDLVSDNAGNRVAEAVNEYGLKLPKEKIEEIFEPLYNANNSTIRFFDNKEAFLYKYSDTDANGGNNRVYSPTYAGGRGAIAIGARAVAAKDTSTALGALAFAFSKGSTAVGFLSYVDTNSDGGTAVGRNSRVFSSNALAVGNETEATSMSTLAYGYKAKAVGEGALAIGNSVAANAMFVNTQTRKDLSKYYKDLSDKRVELSTSSVDTNDKHKNSAFNTFNTNFNEKFTADNDSIGLPLKPQDEEVFLIGNKHIKKIKPQDNAKNAIVLGNKSFAVKNNSIALGYATLADADNAFAVGSYSYVNKNAKNSIAFGVGAYVGIGNTTPVDNDDDNNNDVDLSNSLALGTFSSVRSKNSVAIGPFSSIGSNAIVTNGNNTAVGYLSSVTSGVTDSVSLGSSSATSASRSVAIGNSAQASQENSVALGYRSTTAYVYNPGASGSSADVSKRNRSPVLPKEGGGFDTTHADANKLNGYVPAGSSYNIPVDNSAGVVSVGGWRATDDKVGLRRIINVAPGALDTDVATVGQLRALEYTKSEPNVVYYTLDTQGKAVKLVVNSSDGKLYPVDTTNGEPIANSTAVDMSKVFIGPKNPKAGTLALNNSSGLGNINKSVTGLGAPLPFGNVSSVTTSATNRSVSSYLTPNQLYLGDTNNDPEKFHVRLDSGNGGNNKPSLTLRNGSADTAENLYVTSNEIQSWNTNSSAGTGVTFDGSKITLKGATNSGHLDTNTQVIFDGQGNQAGLTVRNGSTGNQGLFMGSNQIKGIAYANGGTTTDQAGITFYNDNLTLTGTGSTGAGGIRIKQLGAGEDDTDAVNVSQLKKLTTSLKNVLGDNFTIPTNGDVKNITVNAPTDNGGIGGTGQTTVNAAIQSLKTSLDKGFIFQGVVGGSQKQPLGSTLYINSGDFTNNSVDYKGDNLSTKYTWDNSNKGTISIGLRKDPTFASVTAQEGNAKVLIGSNQIIAKNNDTALSGLTFYSGSISLTGTNDATAGGIKITNVGAGSEGTDAVNVSQLKALGKSIKDLLGTNFTANSDGLTVTAPTNSGTNKGIGGTGQTTVNKAIEWLKNNASGKITYKVNSTGNTETQNFNFVANSDVGDSTGNILLTDVNGTGNKKNGTVKIALNPDLNVTSITAGTAGKPRTQVDSTGVHFYTNGTSSVANIGYDSNKIVLSGVSGSSNSNVTVAGVKDGATQYEAVNYGQLTSLAEQVRQILGDGVTGKGTTLTGKNIANLTGANTVSGAISHLNTRLTKAEQGYIFKGQNGTPLSLPLNNNTINLTAGDFSEQNTEYKGSNLYVHYNNNGTSEVKFTFGLKEDPIFKTVTAKNGSKSVVLSSAGLTGDKITLKGNDSNGTEVIFDAKDTKNAGLTVKKGNQGLLFGSNQIKGISVKDGSTSDLAGITFDNGSITLTGTNAPNTGGVQIKGVGKGTDNTDAVNVTQLSELLTQIKNVLGDNVSKSIDNGSPTLTGADIGGTNQSTVSGAIGALKTKLDTAGYKFKGQNGTEASLLSLGSTVALTADDFTANNNTSYKGSNLYVKYENGTGTFKIGLKDEVSFKTVTASNGNKKATRIDSTGVQFYTPSSTGTGATPTLAAKISYEPATTATGGSTTPAIKLSNGTNDIRLTGVANGSSNNDAVNYGQLTGLATNVAKVLGTNVTASGTTLTASDIGGTGKTTVAEAIEAVYTLAQKKITFQDGNAGSAEVGLGETFKIVGGKTNNGRELTEANGTTDRNSSNVVVPSVVKATGNNIVTTVSSDTSNKQVTISLNKDLTNLNFIGLNGNGANDKEDRNTLALEGNNEVHGGGLLTVRKNYNGQNAGSYVEIDGVSITGYGGNGNTISQIEFTTKNKITLKGNTKAVDIEDPSKITPDTLTTVTLDGLSDGSLASGSHEAVTGNQIKTFTDQLQNILGKNATGDSGFTATTTTSPNVVSITAKNIGGTGQTDINAAIKYVNDKIIEGYTIKGNLDNGDKLPLPSKLYIVAGKLNEGDIVYSSTNLKTKFEKTTENGKDKGTLTIGLSNTPLFSTVKVGLQGTSHLYLNGNSISGLSGEARQSGLTFNADSIQASGSANNKKPKITNVAEGDLTDTSNDVVTGKQLKASLEKILGGKVKLGTNKSKDGDHEANTLLRPETEGKAPAVAGVPDATDIGDAIYRVYELAKSGSEAQLYYTANDTTDPKQHVTLAKGLTFKAESNGNLSVKAEADGVITYTLNKDLKLDSVTTGLTKVDTNGVQFYTNGTDNDQKLAAKISYEPATSATTEGDSGSTATPAIKLSNDSNKEIRLTGVADGKKDKDAVNYGQLDNALKSIAKELGVEKDKIGTDTTPLFPTIANGKDGKNGETGSTGANGQDGIRGTITKVINTINKGYRLGANSKYEQADPLYLGSQIYLDGDDNVKVAYNQTEAGNSKLATGKFNFSLNKDLSVDSITAGANGGEKTRVDASGVHFYTDSTTPAASIGYDKTNKVIKLSGDDNTKAVKLTNLADGAISDKSSDAVTGKQLYDLSKVLGITPNTDKTGFDNNLGITAINGTNGTNGAAGSDGTSGTNGKYQPTTIKDAINKVIERVNTGYVVKGNVGGADVLPLGSNFYIQAGTVSDSSLGKTVYSATNLKTKFTKDATTGNGVLYIGLSNTPVFADVTATNGTTGSDSYTKLTSTGLAHYNKGAGEEKSTVKSSVTLGNDAITLNKGTGSNPIKLTGVAKGSETNDAVNYGQLTTLADAIKDVLGGGVDSSNGTLTKPSVSNDATTGGIGNTGKNTVSDAIASVLNKVNTNATDAQLYYAADKVGTGVNNTESTVKNPHTTLKTGLTFQAGDNLNVKIEEGGKVTYGLNKDVTGLNSVGLENTTNKTSANLTTEKLTFTNTSDQLGDSKVKTATFGDDGVTLDLGGTNQTVKVAKDGFSTPKSHLGDDLLTVGDKANKHTKVTNDGYFLYSNDTTQTFGITAATGSTHGAAGNASAIQFAGATSTTPIVLTGVDKGLVSETSNDAINGTQLYNVIDKLREQLGLANNQLNPNTTKAEENLINTNTIPYGTIETAGGKITTGSGEGANPTTPDGTSSSGGGSGSGSAVVKKPTIGESLKDISAVISKGYTFTTGNKAEQPLYLGAELYVNGDDNISVEYTRASAAKGTYDVKLKQDITVNSVTAKSYMYVGNTSGSHLAIDGQGIQAKKDKNGSTTSGFTFQNGNIDLVGENKKVGNTGVGITNLARGELSENSTDAINGSQLYNSLATLLGIPLKAEDDKPGVLKALDKETVKGATGVEATTIADAIKAVNKKVDENATKAKFGYKAKGEQLYHTTLEQGLTFNNTDGNIQIASDKNNKGQLYFDLNKDITGLNSVGLKDNSDKEAKLTTENLTFTKPSGVTNNGSDGTTKTDTVTFGNDGVTLEKYRPETTTVDSGNPSKTIKDTVKVGNDGFSVKSEIVNGTDGNTVIGETTVAPNLVTVGEKDKAHTEVAPDGFYSKGAKTNDDTTAPTNFSITYQPENAGSDGTPSTPAAIKLGGKNGDPIVLTNLEKGKLTGKNSSDATTVGQLYDLAETVLGINPTTTGSVFEKPKFTGSILGNGANASEGKPRTLTNAIQTIANSIDGGYTFSDKSGLTNRSAALPLGSTLYITNADISLDSTGNVVDTTTTTATDMIKYGKRNLAVVFGLDKSNKKEGIFNVGLAEKPTFTTLRVDNGASIGSNGALTKPYTELSNNALTYYTSDSNPVSKILFSDDAITLGKGDSSAIKLKGVAAGSLVSGGTEAVNAGQLYDVIKKLNTLLAGTTPTATNNGNPSSSITVTNAENAGALILTPAPITTPAGSDSATQPSPTGVDAVVNNNVVPSISGVTTPTTTPPATGGDTATTPPTTTATTSALTAGSGTTAGGIGKTGADNFSKAIENVATGLANAKLKYTVNNGTPKEVLLSKDKGLEFKDGANITANLDGDAVKFDLNDELTLKAITFKDSATSDTGTKVSDKGLEFVDNSGNANPNAPTVTKDGITVKESFSGTATPDFLENVGKALNGVPATTAANGQTTPAVPSKANNVVNLGDTFKLVYGPDAKVKKVYADGQVVPENAPVDPNKPTYDVVVGSVEMADGTKETKALLTTYDAYGNTATLTNTPAEAIHRINMEGIRFFHVNDGVARKRGNGRDELDASAKGKYSVAIGTQSKADGERSIAIGSNNNVTGNQSIAIGTDLVVNGNNSGAIGDPSVVNASHSYAVGNNNYVGVKTEIYTALGKLSVGTVTTEQLNAIKDELKQGGITIPNVDSITDARGLTKALKDQISTTAIANTQDIFVLGNNALINENANGAIALGSDTVVSTEGSGAIGKGAKANLTKAQLQNTTADQTPYVLTKTAESYAQVRGKGAEVVGEISLGKAEVKDDSGQVVAKAETRRLTNIAAGVNDTDAVNVSQLKTIGTQIINNTNAINNLNQRLVKESNTLRAGISGSVAMANLPQAFLPGKSVIAVAAGSYKGQNAVAFGVSKVSDSGSLILKLSGSSNSQGNLSGGVGIGYQW